MPKEKPNSKYLLEKSFGLLLGTLLSQIALYGAIKANGNMNVWLAVALNIVAILASYNICNYTMLQMFLYSISEDK